VDTMPVEAAEFLLKRHIYFRTQNEGIDIRIVSCVGSISSLKHAQWNHIDKVLKKTLLVMQLLSEHVPQDAHNSGEKIHLFEQLVRHLAAVTGSELRIYGSHKRIYRPPVKRERSAPAGVGPTSD
jgi:hypothetical protein